MRDILTLEMGLQKWGKIIQFRSNPIYANPNWLTVPQKNTFEYYEFNYVLSLSSIKNGFLWNMIYHVLMGLLVYLLKDLI